MSRGFAIARCGGSRGGGADTMRLRESCGRSAPVRGLLRCGGRTSTGSRSTGGAMGYVCREGKKFWCCGGECCRWGRMLDVVMLLGVVMVGLLGGGGVEGARGREYYGVNGGGGGEEGLESRGVIGLREVRLGTGSILQALLDSQYSELVWYLEKGEMLQELERKVSQLGGITILAPKNSFLEQHVSPEMKAFLLQPGHEAELQRVLRYHVLPGRLVGADWGNRSVSTLAGDALGLRSYGLKRFVEFSRVFSPNSILRKDGVVHGLDGFMIPSAVSLQFEAWKRGARDVAVLPQSPPAAASRSRFMLQKKPSLLALPKAPASPKLARAPAPSVAFPPAIASPVAAPALSPDIAPAPGPGTADFSLDEDDETLQFVTAMMNYGGYNEITDLLMNFTTLGVELGKLAHMGYKVTILAPNDQAMRELTEDQLNSPLEPLLYYHMLSEYQTEESMYNAVKRLGKQSYSTLRHPHKVQAMESDGTVQFGEGEDAAHIFDHDIYVDGHLSVQGISKVLVMPP